ncbi:MAG TPA: hypothetical protein ENI95_12530 [Chloroflexi bacterium]|nr:hypothetical protein [Chloroflexota bacterium]
MGRIRKPELQTLADEWSPVVRELLDQLGKKIWPPKKERPSLLQKPRLITRYSLEGPAQRGNELAWALSHTTRPSSFDDTGRLTEGEREFWLVTLRPGDPPTFRIEGAQVIADIPADREALRKALRRARKMGPKVQTFYGNKGPLSHR